MSVQRRDAVPADRTFTDDSEDSDSVHDNCPKASTEIRQRKSDKHADHNSSRHSIGTAAELMCFVAFHLHADDSYIASVV